MDALLKFNFQENITKGMAAIATTTNRVMNGINTLIDKTTNNLSNLNKPVNLNINTNSIKNANNEIEHLNKNLSFLQTSGAMFIGGLATRGLEHGIATVMEGARSMFESGVEIQKTKVGLTTFTKSPEKANAIVDDIMKSSTMTPYTTQALLPGIRGIMASGASYEKAKKDEWAIANAIAATGGSNWDLERVSRDMVKAAAKGQVTGREINELTTAGIPITSLLQKSLPELKGLSNNDAKTKLEDMTLTYNQLANALFIASQKGGMFENALANLSQTIGGKWSTVVDYWQMSGAHLTEKFIPQITQIEDRLIGAMKKFETIDFTPIVSGLVKAINSMMDFGKWIWNNRTALMSLVSVVTDAIKLWVGYKVAIFALQGLIAIDNLLIAIQTKGIIELTRARIAEDIGITKQTASLTAQNVALTENIALARMAVSVNSVGAGLAGTASTGLAAGSLAGTSIQTGLIAGIAMSKLSDAATIAAAQLFKFSGWFSIASLFFSSGKSSENAKDGSGMTLAERNNMWKKFDEGLNEEHVKQSMQGISSSQSNIFNSAMKNIGHTLNTKIFDFAKMFTAKNPAKDDSEHTPINTGVDANAIADIKGNTPKVININMREKMIYVDKIVTESKAEIDNFLKEIENVITSSIASAAYSI